MSEDDDRSLPGMPRLAPPVDDPAAADTPSLTPFARRSLLGVVLGERYRIEQRLVSGGMGEVYLGRDLTLDRAVAVKIMLSPDDRAGQQRFFREARLCSQVQHPHVVQMLDYGKLPGGEPYLVMELLRGQTLREALVGGPMGPSRACGVARQIALGLQALHRVRITHRDLKPDNIFLLRHEGLDDFVKIADFGLAISAASSHLTGSELVGTPAYMAPEQVRSARVDERADQYALGCILYELLTGQVPFPARTVEATVKRHLQERPQAPSARRPDLGISAALDELVLRLLKKDPRDRYRSPEELAEVLLRAPMERTLRERLGGVAERLLGRAPRAR